MISALLARLEEAPEDLIQHAIVADWYEENGYATEAFVHRALADATDLRIIIDRRNRAALSGFRFDLCVRPGSIWETFRGGAFRVRISSEWRSLMSNALLRGIREAAHYWEQIMALEGWVRSSFGEPREIWSKLYEHARGPDIVLEKMTEDFTW